MSRREAVKRVSVLLGGAVSAPALAGVLGGCRIDPSAPAYELQTLDSDQNALVATIAEHIIPETDTPGARQARVNEFIDLMLTEWYTAEDRQRFLGGLDGVEAESRDRYGNRFVDCTHDDQIEMLTEMDQAAYEERGGERPAPFFRTMKELTLLGYYTSEIGATQELRWDPIPGRFDGCVPFDEVGRAFA